MTKNTKFAVYRYIDMADGITKYVGIVKNGTLIKRIYAHRRDSWCQGKNWKVQYFECDNQSEVEAFESHLIALYETHKFYNKSKSNWGINKYLPSVEDWWKNAENGVYADYETFLFAKKFREILKAKRYDLARELINYVEYSEV